MLKDDAITSMTKGSVNKLTLNIKESLMDTFQLMGGTKALHEWAIKNPSKFFELWIKLLPKEVNNNIANKDGEEFKIKEMSSSEAARKIAYVFSSAILESKQTGEDNA